MKKLSTGADSNLRNWIELSTFAFGKYSPAVKFLEKKAEESPNGLDEEVVADERQLLLVLVSLNDKNKGGH